MRFKLFDKNEVYKGNLKEILKAEREEELNGKHILETTILNKDDNAKYIEKKGRLLYKDKLGNWQEFIIRGITSPHEDTITMELYCENSIYELWGDYIEDRRPQNTTANIALGVALEGTRFEVGIVDDLGISSTNFYHIFAKEAVNKIAEAWNCEIRVRIVVVGNEVTHRYIDLLKRRGAYRGKRYEYSKDLLSITKTVHNDDPITALYGYGKGEQIGDGYGRRIDFKDIEWSKSKGDPLDKPLGQAYISDPGVLEQWGRPGVNGKANVFDKVDYDDCEDEEELLNLTYEEYLKRSKLQISYEGKVINLREIEGSEHEGVELGDDVGVIDKEYKPAIRVFARVLRYKEDLLDTTNDDVTLANFIKDITSRLKENKKFIDNFRSKQGAWDKADFFDKDGLPSQHLKNLIDELNTKMNETGGYTYFREGKGIEILNKPEDINPTESMMLGGGYIAIADTKKPNGDWDYKTFGTGTGFTADLIRTGILQGGKVKFDLTNGTLLIGNSIEDYSLLFDGNSLKIRLSSGKTIEQEVSDNVDNAIQNAPIYTWIKYSMNPDGTNMTSDPTNAKYIGIAEGKTSSTPSNIASDYKWTKIAGEDGKDGIGIKGETGADGKTSYLHIKYSNDGGQSFTGNGGEDAGSWIGTYTDFSQADSTSLSKYQWVKIEGQQGPRGLQGIQGETGEKGIPGPKGADGKDSYTHIAYSNSQDGTVGFSTSDSTNKSYVGMYVDHIETDSGTPSDYNWTKIKGADGSQGIAGPKGDNGETPYLHIAYANNSTGTSGFSTTDSNNKLYIGQYTDFIQADSNTPSKYAWTLIKGDKGDKGNTGATGPQGIQGPPGENGETLYTWVKYADTPTSGMSDSPTGKEYLGLAYNKTTPVESANYSDYTWSLVKGPKGDQGVEGPKGTDGQTTYTWIKYADDEDGSGMSDSPEGKNFIGIAYNKTVVSESSNPANYTWSSISGNIQVGGRNLLRNSDFSNGLENWSGNGIIVQKEGRIAYEFVGNEDVNLQGLNKNSYFPLENNQTYVYWVEIMPEADVSFSASTPLHYHIKNETTGSAGGGKQYIKLVSNNIAKANKWNKIILEFKTIEDEPVTFKPYIYFFSTGIKAWIRHFKLEKGNIATDWTPAPEDVEADRNEAIAEVTTTMQSNLEQTEELIRTEVSESYTAKSDFETFQSETSTKFDQTSEDFLFQFTELTSQISGLDDDTKARFNELIKYIRFVDGNIILGEVGNEITLKIQNDRIAFLRNDVEVAYLSNNTLYITDARVLNSIRIGNFAFIPRSNGNLSFKKVGE